MPHKGQKKLTCGAFGPGNSEEYLDRQIKMLLELPEGWFIHNLHGLDSEGYGPCVLIIWIGLLARLIAIDSVSVMPAGRRL
jgi:hypothetical protein